MVNSALVNLYGQNIGVIQWNSLRNVAEFEYVSSFQNQGIEPSPLLMPVRPGVVYSFNDIAQSTFKGLPGLIADSLPDTYGRALFDRWLSLTGRTSSNPVETLCYLGKRCMGALEYEPVIEATYDRNSLYEISSLVDVANEVLNAKDQFAVNLDVDKKAAIADIVRLGTSAGGQRAKAIIAYNKETGEVRSGQINAPEGFDYYLIKLDGVNGETGLKATQNFGRLEYSFYQLVKQSGIEMSDSHLIEENGRAHFMTKRFDRKNGGKLHIQTLCAIAHYDFHNPNAYSYEQAFNVMRMMRLPYSDTEELFRRMVFNVIVRNQDDHTKNISFIMDRAGTWRLSPAYDMGYAYNPQGAWTARHQMSVNGKFDYISRQDILEVGSRNNIKNAGILIDSILDVASQWPRLASETGVPDSMIRQIFPNFRLRDIQKV